MWQYDLYYILKNYLHDFNKTIRSLFTFLKRYDLYYIRQNYPYDFNVTMKSL